MPAVAELLLPADVEVAVVTEFEAALPTVTGYATVDVGTRLPSPMVGDIIRVVGVGGTSSSMIVDSPRVTLEGFSKREGRAYDITSLAVALLERAARDGSVGGVTCHVAEVIALPANLPYPSLPDWYRYLATVSLDLRRSRV